MLPRFTLPLILSLLLGACATGPAFHTAGVDHSLTPQGVASHAQPQTGRHVQWGGVILETANLKDSTQIEVLAYPLDADARPLGGSNPLGRFILEQAGYLEPATFAEGRQVTVVGTVAGSRPGQVDTSDYNYPVIRSRQLYLWPADRGRSSVGVGGYIGIGVGSGGHWGSGVGIGF